MSLGIDIGKYSIKIVELLKDKDKVYVNNIGKINNFSDLNKFDPEKITKTQFSASIQDLCKKLNIKPRKIKKVTSSLPGDTIDIRQITTLEMPEDELVVSLELEAKKHVPLDGTDAIIDYHHLGGHNEKLDQINILLATTTKSKINDHADILKNLGIKPGIFDANPIALANIYQHNNKLPDEGADVVINIGNSSTTLIVWGGNSGFFTREISISGNNITNEIMQKFKLSYSSPKVKFSRNFYLNSIVFYPFFSLFFYPRVLS